MTAHDLALPRVVAALRGTAKAASLLPLLVGVLVLIGWAADVETLKRIIPGLTAMNPMTAVGFMCLGCALALEIGAAGRPRPALTTALALVVVILGLSRIVALAGLRDLQLDWLLFRDKVDVGEFGRPNRIAPNTAINFVLTGIALIVMDRGGGRFRTLAQMLALVAGITSLLALMGYAYGLRPFYGIGSQIAMALPTAVTFLVVAIGILCARPADGIMSVISSLAYLKRFPVDILKIDKSFVDGVANQGHDTAIVEAIIALGHALGLKVIAEGVETPDQLRELRSLGSELGQGYFFGRPLSDDAAKGMPSLLEAHERWRKEERS